MVTNHRQVYILRWFLTCLYIYWFIYSFILLIYYFHSYVGGVGWMICFFYAATWSLGFFPHAFSAEDATIFPLSASTYSNLQPIWNVYFSFSKEHARKIAPCLFLITLLPSDCKSYNSVNHTQLWFQSPGLAGTGPSPPHRPAEWSTRTASVHC